MIAIEQIKPFYPEAIRENAQAHKYILKEYLLLLILDFLSATNYAKKIIFIGGTSLRLAKGIDRFSEDLDFDCRSLSKNEFENMSDAVLLFLRRNGFDVEAREKVSNRLTAFRRSLHFPGLLFAMGLSRHRDERFMVKLEAQDQGIQYVPVMSFIKGCGFFFPFPAPPDPVLCAMKISAMLSRRKGRDFYDVMFLLSRTQPDYQFLAARCGIRDLAELKCAVENLLKSVDLRQKKKDFEHLLFQHDNAGKITHFREFIHAL